MRDLTTIVVSHDRNFLDLVCTDIMLMKDRSIRYYPGNYSEFVGLKEEKGVVAQKAQAKIDKKREAVEKQIQKCKSLLPNRVLVALLYRLKRRSSTEWGSRKTSMAIDGRRSMKPLLGVPRRDMGVDAQWPVGPNLVSRHALLKRTREISLSRFLLLRLTISLEL